MKCLPVFSVQFSVLSGCQDGKRKVENGSSLIAVFWMIAVLGMVIFSANAMLENDSRSARLMRDRALAKRNAEKGLEIGRHPRMELHDPLLYGEGYRVTLTTEEARFNINSLLLNSDRLILKRIFNHWGFKPEFSSRVIDALKDWVDEDGNVSLNGAEKREYEKTGLDGLPFNRPFKQLDDMLLVREFDVVNAVYPGWRDWFTIFGDGKLDVNEARSDFIAVLADVPPERLRALDALRAGRDGSRGTMDDGKLTSAIQVAQLLNVFQPKIVQELQEWIQFQGPIRRIESIGSYNELSRKLLLITQNNQTLWRGEIPAQ
jgi:general secretion pathway protein K